MCWVRPSICLLPHNTLTKSIPEILTSELIYLASRHFTLSFNVFREFPFCCFPQCFPHFHLFPCITSLPLLPFILTILTSLYPCFSLVFKPKDSPMHFIHHPL